MATTGTEGTTGHPDALQAHYTKDIAPKFQRIDSPVRRSRKETKHHDQNVIAGFVANVGDYERSV